MGFCEGKTREKRFYIMIKKNHVGLRLIMYLAWSMNYFPKINRDPTKKILPQNVALGQCKFLSTCLFDLNGRRFGHFVYLCVCVCVCVSQPLSFASCGTDINHETTKHVFGGVMFTIEALVWTHGCRQSFVYTTM